MSEVESTTIQLNLTQALRVAAWGALGLGCLLVLIGASSARPNLLIIACFLGIVSRILQAEGHQAQRVTGR